MTLEELQQACLLPPEALERELAALEKRKSALRVGVRWMSGAACEELQAEILARLEAFHKAQPLLPSLELTVLREALHAGAEMLEAVLARMGKAVVVEGAGLRLAAHAVKAEGAEGRRLGTLAEVFRRAGLSPPDPGPAFVTAGMPAPEGEKLLVLLVKQGTLVRAADGIHFHKEPLAAARDKVVAACQGGKELSTPQARELFAGVSRKHLIPLLEQFDKEGLTRRVGNARFLRTAMRKT